MIRYANHYLPSDAARKNLLAVPMLAELSKLPPLYIAGCEFDPSLDDSKRLADRARSAGVRLEFTIWEGMVHGPLAMGWIEAMGAEGPFALSLESSLSRGDGVDKHAGA
jgi:acetyl esterase/lipase